MKMLRSNSAALRKLYLIAHSCAFHRLRLLCREALADFFGAARGLKRGLRVTLEVWHHLARDQFVAAQCCWRVRPIVCQHEIGAESALRLLPQPIDLRRACIRRTDGAEAGAVDELDHLADRIADHRHLREGCN